MSATVYRWVATDEDGQTYAYTERPVRSEFFNMWVPQEGDFKFVDVEKVMEKIGYHLGWKNDPVKMRIHKKGRKWYYRLRRRKQLIGEN